MGKVTESGQAQRTCCDDRPAHGQAGERAEALRALHSKPRVGPLLLSLRHARMRLRQRYTVVPVLPLQPQLRLSPLLTLLLPQLLCLLQTIRDLGHILLLPFECPAERPCALLRLVDVELFELNALLTVAAVGAAGGLNHR